MSNVIYQDGIVSELKFEGDTLVHKTTQPTEDLILERNKKLRQSPGAILDLGEKSGESFGRHVACIPVILFNKAIKDGFDLMSKDKTIADREMIRYLQSPEGQACLVQENAIYKPKIGRS